jgi:hypothetical protein
MLGRHEEDGPMAELNIEMGRAELLKTLKENLEKHKKEYEESRKGWIDKLLADLAKAPERAKALAEKVTKAFKDGDGSVEGFNFQRLVPEDWHDAPVSYADHYADAIEMLTMAKDEKISLSRTLWRQLVKDEWEWKSRHMLSNRKYSQMGQR